ncbi:EcsC family protein [Roseicella sp. DB1501]|uniref:EcsC family protein n=1 Tax=Roseicella sp. DB1501 TaxID=2730925 RepID=UPI001490D569|nr:EcsC family protein [Roseicella sp. DB1501]NOG73719.1 EcsC family protein [Roseicella sp. DB1501]
MSAGTNWLQNSALQSLNTLYDTAIGSAKGMQATAEELADQYRRKHVSVDDAVASLIRWQAAKTGATGFATGLPGLIAMPVTLPADMTSLWYVQLRMVAAIASLYGHDPRDEVVRTIAFYSLLGGGAIGAVSKTGVTIGNKTAMAALTRLPGHVLLRVNRLIGYRLVTKFGTKGVINLVKLVPIAGGVIGGTINAVGTNATGKAAILLLRQA